MDILNRQTASQSLRCAGYNRPAARLSAFIVGYPRIIEVMRIRFGQDAGFPRGQAEADYGIGAVVFDAPEQDVRRRMKGDGQEQLSEGGSAEGSRKGF
jgi:hypothetical protein